MTIEIVFSIYMCNRDNTYLWDERDYYNFIEKTEAYKCYLIFCHKLQPYIDYSWSQMKFIMMHHIKRIYPINPSLCELWEIAPSLAIE